MSSTGIITVSTGEFRDLVQRMGFVAQRCDEWVTQAQVSIAVTGHPLQPSVMSVVGSIATALRGLAERVSIVANRYDDHEAASSRLLAAVATEELITVLGPLDFLGALVGLRGVAEAISNRSNEIDVSETATAATSAPDSLFELLARIPARGALTSILQDASQIRIDEYAADGQTRYIVYIEGTLDFSLTSTDEPWDMTSNIAAVLGERQSASERAVREAMADAGIRAEDPVILVGHSQGGLVGARIAQSGDYRVTDLVTAGAPLRSVAIPPSVRVTILEHTDDLVPSLSGVPLASVAGAALLVRAASPDPTSSDMAEPHRLLGYLDTAARAETDSSPVLRQRLDRLERETRSSGVTTRWYRATRKKSG